MTVARFLTECAELGLSASVGTTWDTANLVDIDRTDPIAGKHCQYLVRVNSTKRSKIPGRVAVRVIAQTPQEACQKAAEKLKQIHKVVEL